MYEDPVVVRKDCHVTYIPKRVFTSNLGHALASQNMTAAKTRFYDTIFISDHFSVSVSINLNHVPTEHKSYKCAMK